MLCYTQTLNKVLEISKDSILKGDILHIHPEWLFQRGKINRRGPFYDILRTLLKVDKELETLFVYKKGSVRIAKDRKEYEKSIIPTQRFIEKLRERRIDIYIILVLRILVKNGMMAQGRGVNMMTGFADYLIHVEWQL